ncbi:PAS domain-containing protein [Albidovulum inexpectatum]|uniref:PAS domain-containing protein n=1 Tax=Albidovulum inexpectatum TaxID=196587 RepID=A0A2S5JMS7_9RHOB|nr:PAS-domain containing protein [Albidovulum inexpectatum]PPB82698.1 PAS domain-containing protein [Albidovulum inexpectatum]
MALPWIQLAGIAASSTFAAISALLIWSRLAGHRRHTDLGSPVTGDPTAEILLFDGHDLIDATRAARRLVDGLPGPGSKRDRVLAFLRDRIAGLDDALETLPRTGSVMLHDRHGALHLRAEWLAGRLRLCLWDASKLSPVLPDPLCLRAQEEELDLLRGMMGSAPIPIWRTAPDGSVTWANDAYLKLAAQQGNTVPESLSWPIPVLFPGPHDADQPRRRMLKPTGQGSARWFECHSRPDGESQVHYALPADAAVRAETSLRDFIQTLTKTFADLPIGLAIFDRQRRLTLFNPALVDLTSVEVDFLSARPTLGAFWDRLREARVVPEPRDWHDWRARMTELAEAAASGCHEETWTLPSGETWRVTGRPHPDGAVAFLFEDISAEMTLTRHFRAEIEMGQSVVNSLRSAIAVFSPAGTMLLSNAAYDALWGTQTTDRVSPVTITDSLRLWQKHARPSPIFGEIRDYIANLEERTDWDADIVLTSGERVACRVSPLAGGATLVEFDPVRPALFDLTPIRAPLPVPVAL